MSPFDARRVTVMGLGRFGGGVGVARWLARQGADVLVTDTAPAADLAGSVAALQDLIDAGAVTLRLGEHNVSDFTTADLIVANPAVPKPWDNRFLRAARAAGIPITTEISLLIERLPSRAHTIAVTGAAGKSTTAAMIAHALERTGHPTALGGNIGGSLLDRLPSNGGPHGCPAPKGQTACDRDAPPPRPEGAQVRSHGWSEAAHAAQRNPWEEASDPVRPGRGGSAEPCADPASPPNNSANPPISPSTFIVLELSSFMLHWIDRTIPGGWSPHIAVVTNIAPNHLDWHGSFEHYVTSKQHILRRQRPGDTAVLGSTAEPWRALTPAAVRPIDPASFPIPLAIPGEHNRANAAAALAACTAADPATPPSAFADAIASFPGLPHRLQFVGEHNGVRFYNDSKSTIPEAALRAIEALAAMPGMSPARLRLIAGGYDKGADLAPLATAAGTLGGLYTIGATGPSLAAAARARGARAADCATLDRAVERALSDARPGDALLLSPACASWDQFTNYEHRGDRFIHLVQQTMKGRL